MDNKNEIYFLNKKYYDWLVDNELEEIEIKFNRPYIGFIKIKFSKYDYIIPLTSQSHNYNPKYKYSIPTFVNGRIKDVLQINKMIPILDNNLFINKADEKKLSYNLKAQLNYLNKPEIMKQIICLAIEARKMQDPKLRFNINFNHAEKLCKEYVQSMKGSDNANINNNINANKEYSISLYKKNIVKEVASKFNKDETNIFISIPKIGLHFVPKKEVEFFKFVDDKTGKAIEKIKLTFDEEKNYKLFLNLRNKEDNKKISIVDGKTLGNRINELTVKGLISVDFTRNNLSSTQNIKKKEISFKQQKGMEI